MATKNKSSYGFSITKSGFKVDRSAPKPLGTLLVEAAAPLLNGILQALGGGGQDNSRQMEEMNREHARKTEEMAEYMKKEQESNKKKLAAMAEENDKREKQHNAKMEKIMRDHKDDAEKMAKLLQEEQATAEKNRKAMQVQHKEDMETHKFRMAKARQTKMKMLTKAQTRMRNFYPPPRKLTSLMRDLKTKGIGNAIMIACCGSTGVGKSSWINAITDSNSARTGTAGECTTELAYFPYNPEGTGAGFVFVDCPGGGTPRFPKQTYVKEMGLRYYDIVLFFCHSRFSEADMCIMQDCKSNRINYFAVGTKVGLSLSRLKKEEPNKKEPEHLMMLKETLRWYHDGSGRKEAAALDKIFLSDSDDMLFYDTNELIENIVDLAAAGRTPKVNVGDDGNWTFADPKEAEEHAQLAQIMVDCDIGAADRKLLGMAVKGVGKAIGRAFGGRPRGRNDEKTNW